MSWLGRLDLPAYWIRIPAWLASLVIGLSFFTFAVMLRLMVNWLWPTAVPFGFMMPMILLATLFGRWLGGFTCYILGGLLLWHNVQEELAAAGMGSENIFTVLVVYVVMGAMLVLIVEAYRGTESALRREQMLRAEGEAERQRLLVDELSHRIKNMLGAVQAIASQTLGKTDVTREVRATLEDRLVALGRAHDLLTESAWSPVPIDRLVADAIFAFEDGNRFHVGGPAIALPPHQAIAVAIALHELATNAIKYGSLTVPEGKVDVAWRRDGDGFHLSWIERDGPPVKAPQHMGFGTRLLSHNLAAELGGKVDFEFAVTGVRWEIGSPRIAGPPANKAVAATAIHEPASRL